jgi:hypothetical protein
LKQNNIASQQYLALLSKEDHTALVAGVAELINNRWAFSDGIIDPVIQQAVGMKVPRNWSVDQLAWLDQMEKSPQRSLWGSTAIQASILKAFTERDATHSQPPSPLAIQVARVATKTLGTFDPSSDYSRKQVLSAALPVFLSVVEAGLMDGQEIPSRWLRRLPPDERSALSRRLLATQAAKVREDGHSEGPAPRKM